MRHENLKKFAEHADRSRLRFRFLGLRRSGNHGLIRWIIENTEGQDKVFFNNCKPVADPFVRFPQVQLFGTHAGTYQKKDYIHLLNDEPDLLARVDAFFISYEDVSLRVLDAPPGHRLSGPAEKFVTQNLYVLRDFGNWAASFWPHLARQIGSKDLNRPQPLVHMAQFLRMCQVWKDNLILVRDQAFCAKHAITVLLYDDWTADAAYRQRLLKDLALNIAHIDIPEVSTFGGGSSFDGLSKRADPTAMQTSHRWTLMIDDPQFRQMMALCLSDDAFRVLFAEEFPETAAQLFDALGMPPVSQV